MNQTIYVKRFDTSAVCDVSEDFVLPDYIPEVRRDGQPRRSCR